MGRHVTSQIGPRPSGERTLVWFLAVSLLLHLVLTPVAGWLGLAGMLFDRVAAPSEEPPLERLDNIPIELFEAQEPEAETEALPDEDPVALIEEWVKEPRSPPASSAAAPRPTPNKPESSASPTPEENPDQQESPRSITDAGAPEEQSPAADRSAEPASKPAAASESDAGKPLRAERPKPPRRIDNPVALAGKAGEITKSNASVGLILYAERVRDHRVGKRIAQVLPQLPQWDDYFHGGQLNPVRDFDRLFMAGPSFYHSSELVIALTYNTERRVVRQAIDRLVKREGRWLKDAPMPAAIARADRAERLIIMPPSKSVMIVPPRLRKQAFRSQGLSIPDPKGPEALVAFTVQPSKALARFGLNIPKSVAQASLRLTPLVDGGALVEVSADDESPERARSTATAVERDLNGIIDLISGVSNVLSRFGFGALTQGARLPKVELQAKGKQIWGQVRLDAQQVNFLLDRIERQLRANSRRAGPQASSLPRDQSPPMPQPPAARRSPTNPPAAQPRSPAPSMNSNER